MRSPLTHPESDTNGLRERTAKSNEHEEIKLGLKPEKTYEAAETIKEKKTFGRTPDGTSE